MYSWQEMRTILTTSNWTIYHYQLLRKELNLQLQRPQWLTLHALQLLSSKIQAVQVFSKFNNIFQKKIRN